QFERGEQRDTIRPGGGRDNGRGGDKIHRLPPCWCGRSAYQVRPPSTRIGSVLQYRAPCSGGNISPFGIAELPALWTRPSIRCGLQATVVARARRGDAPPAPRVPTPHLALLRSGGFTIRRGFPPIDR